jgi:hypothetical protein
MVSVVEPPYDTDLTRTRNNKFVIFDPKYPRLTRRQLDLRANRIRIHATKDEKIAGRA